MRKAACARLDKIESDLVSKALGLYDREKYAEFWTAIETLDLFLSVKEGLRCVRKRRKK